MPALTAADREYLSQAWRYVETKDEDVRLRHPTAREAEYATAFVTIDGAIATLALINAATIQDHKLVVATCDGILPVNFRGRPSRVRLFTRRFGGDIEAGRRMLVERADFDHGQKLTTLYLTGSPDGDE